MTGLLVDLGAVDTAGCSGAIWSLAHGEDLDANLVRLHPGHPIDDHVNDEVDVAVFVLSGRGELTIDGEMHQLRADAFVLIPRGYRRMMCPGPTGITYLSIHRRRGPLMITTRPERTRGVLADDDPTRGGSGG
jgi:hypothetical protein